MQYCFLHNEFVPSDRAVVPVSDLALLRGYAVFEFFRFDRHRPVFLREHLERLERSAGALALSLPHSPAGMAQIVAELIRKNRIAEGGIRILLTGGSSPDGYLPGKPRLIVTSHTLPPVAGNGIALRTLAHRRQLPEVKTVDYLAPIQSIQTGGLQDADDLLYQWEGRISECPRSNFFLVTRDGVLATPGADVLYGITRSKILVAAAGLLPVEVRPVLVEELRTAREAFVTSTTREVLPVVAVDSIRLPDARPFTDELRSRFSALRQKAIGGEEG